MRWGLFLPGVLPQQAVVGLRKHKDHKFEASLSNLVKAHLNKQLYPVKFLLLSLVWEAGQRSRAHPHPRTGGG